MIVPQHWAEARRQVRRGKRQISVRRFGWSDDSLEAAQAMADRRADEALARIEAGEFLTRSEPKVPYNGADGLPIREEIVARHGAAIVTRNSYGARCLNVPDVLFADVDLKQGPGLVLSVMTSAVLSLLVIGIGWQRMNWVAGVSAVIVCLLVGVWLAGVIHKVREQLAGSPDEAGLRDIRAFCDRRPNWKVRVYRTPAGLRVVALHRTFEPADAEVQEFFDAIGTDPVYARMCRNQNCFRARLSAKPWRIGIESRLRPRPGVWPVREEAREERRRWIEAYDAAARGYAACRLIDEIGLGMTDSRARDIADLHDRESGARQSLPIA